VPQNAPFFILLSKKKVLALEKVIKAITRAPGNAQDTGKNAAQKRMRSRIMNLVGVKWFENSHHSGVLHKAMTGGHLPSSGWSKFPE
jgi:hypothetical protein